MTTLVDLLHLRALIVLQRRQVIIVLFLFGNIILVNAQTKLDHAVDTASEGGGLIEVEARGQQRGVEQEPDEVFHSFVVFVLISACAQSINDRVHRVDLHCLLGGHVARHGAVLEGLGLHDALHVGGPAVLASHQAAWGACQPVGDDDLLGLVAKHLLHELTEVLACGLLLLKLLLLVLGLLEVEALLGDSHQLLAIVLLKLLDRVLVDGVDHVQHLKATLLELFNEWSSLDSLLGLTSDEVDVLLVLLHTGNILLETGHLVTRLGGVVPQKLGKLGTVLAVLVDAELDVLAELLVELIEVLGVLGNLVEALQSLLDEVLLDNLEDLATLQHFTGDVEREVLGIHDSLHEGEPLWAQVLAVVADEHAAHIQLDVGLLLGRLEEVEWRTFWDEQASLELQLALHREVLHGEVVFPVVGDVLVEGGILLLGDLLRVAHPERLLLVHELPFVGDLLHSLFLLLLLLVVLIDLGLVVILVLILVFILIIGDLLLGGLLDPERDGVVDELGVLLDELLDALLVEVLLLVVLQVQDDLGAAGQVGVGVGSHSEGA